MAPSNPIARLQKSPPRGLVRPALPYVATGGVALPRQRNASSPINPSPLREVADMGLNENRSGKLSTTPEGTPPRSRSPKKHDEAQNITNVDMTPPDSKYAIQGPLVIDGSIYRDSITNVTQTLKPDQPEDPFVSTPVRQRQALLNPAAIPVPQISAIIQANMAHVGVSDMQAPRADRLVQPVNAHNAQGLFPKEAKLFVANLSNLLTDDQLEISVNRVFSQIGDCVVIIKRDRNHQPMGFVQFYRIHDANTAMENLNGCTIDGRVIRIEWASARQELIISSLTNLPVSEEDVRKALSGRGPIVAVSPTGPSPTEGGTSKAWLVEFRYYADCKEAVRLMRDNSAYRVVPAPKIQRPTPYDITAPRTPMGTLYKDNDSNSIFLGGLPDAVTEDELRELFAMFGTILSCNIISKPMTTGGMNTFAFMEFKYAEDAASAANTTQRLRGEKIRVERKMYAKRRAARVGPAAGQVPVPMTTPRTPQYLQGQYGHPGGMGQSPFAVATPFATAQQPFMFQDYYTTPPTPVHMITQFSYTTPVAPRAGPQVRGPPTHHQVTPYHAAANYSIRPNNNQGTFSPTPATYGSMNVIAEESEGKILE